MNTEEKVSYLLDMYETLTVTEHEKLKKDVNNILVENKFEEFDEALKNETVMYAVNISIGETLYKLLNNIKTLEGIKFTLEILEGIVKTYKECGLDYISRIELSATAIGIALIIYNDLNN